MSDDEGGLHDGGELDVAVPFVLTLELVQQGLIGGLRETGGKGRDYISTEEKEKKRKRPPQTKRILRQPSLTVSLRVIDCRGGSGGKLVTLHFLPSRRVWKGKLDTWPALLQLGLSLFTVSTPLHRGRTPHAANLRLPDP